MKQFAQCPKCRNANAQQLSFTWWGGVIGPKLFTHVKCQTCGAKYNGKTGKNNTTNIIIYFAIVGIIVFVLSFVFMMIMYL
jgi:predicted nucleic-acid-binding Zn-ribbon protein